MWFGYTKIYLLLCHINNAWKHMTDRQTQMASWGSYLQCRILNDAKCSPWVQSTNYTVLVIYIGSCAKNSLLKCKVQNTFRIRQNFLREKTFAGFAVVHSTANAFPYIYAMSNGIYSIQVWYRKGFLQITFFLSNRKCFPSKGLPYTVIRWHEHLYLVTNQNTKSIFTASKTNC